MANTTGKKYDGREKGTPNRLKKVANYLSFLLVDNKFSLKK